MLTLSNIEEVFKVVWYRAYRRFYSSDELWQAYHAVETLTVRLLQCWKGRNCILVRIHGHRCNDSESFVYRIKQKRRRARTQEVVPEWKHPLRKDTLCRFQMITLWLHFLEEIRQITTEIIVEKVVGRWLCRGDLPWLSRATWKRGLVRLQPQIANKERLACCRVQMSRFKIFWWDLTEEDINKQKCQRSVSIMTK